MRFLALPASLAALVSIARAAPTISAKPLPLLLWHGLGDHYDAEGLHSVGDLVNEIHPDTYVYYVRLDDNGDEDRKATFFGNVNDQIDQVCETIQQDPQLVDKSTGMVRADALGFSQGGQLLRGLIERCDKLSVRTLMTFGSQHNGIADVQACGQWDLLCKGALALMKGNVWSDWVQMNIVPAQYFRTTDDETGEPTQEYLERSNFIADVNNDRKEKNTVYKERLSQLDMFVMLVFENDTTVIPRQSGWFAEVNMTDQKVTPLRERPVYLEDWLGLRKLDEKKGLACLTNPGNHMQLDEGVLREVFELYFGADAKDMRKPSSDRVDGCGRVSDRNSVSIDSSLGQGTASQSLFKDTL